MQPRIFGAYEPLRRDYGVEEYLAEALPCGVAKSVFVQVNVAPGGEIDEVAWARSLAQRSGFPQAITAYADLSAPDVGDVLDRETACGGVRAIRQQLHWHANPQYRFAARPDLMNEPAWRRGLAEVRRRGLAFELQVSASQMADAARLAGDFPDLTFILLHAGMPEDRSDAGWRAWRAGMAELAKRPNVVTKLSGLGTFTRACSVELWRPAVERTLELFGPRRCLFGSNFPIEKLWTSYADLLAVMRACLDGCSPAERRAVMHDVAARVYRLG
jgi:predicted TIM-barrel fold metal-dependent hydrolase